MIGAASVTWQDELRRAVQEAAVRKTFDWTGIYLVSGETLLLGPYSGEPTEHSSIAVGTGICGAAAADAATVVVDDVSADPRYLSCFVTTRSEIVVPIFRGGTTDGEVIGEIDIDSETLAAFTDTDRRYLEAMARRLGSIAPPNPLAGIALNEQLSS